MSNKVEMPSPGHMDAEGSGRGDVAYGAEALDDLLNILAGQISNADRQHSDTMREMQTRLTRLGDHTETVKAGLPNQHASAFERIESGMTELADRFAEGNRAQRTPASHATPRVEATAPPTFAYSLPEADTFEFVPAITSKPALVSRSPAAFEERWDRQDVEALTRHYETADEEPAPRRSAHPSAMSIPRPVFTASELPAPTHSRASSQPSASIAQLDPSWLDSRLADIATRVEQSLAALRPESALLAINQRFDQFERRVTSVLDDVAARADVGGLGEVEKHIQALSQQVEQVYGQLGRLERLETQVGTLRDKLSDEHIVQLFGDLIPTQEDLVRFAEQAAINTAERMVARRAMDDEPSADGNGAEPADNSAGLASIHALLSASIEDGKRGDATTAEILDTIQLALQQVLDRIETLEAIAQDARTQSSQPVSAFASQIHTERFIDPISQPLQSHVAKAYPDAGAATHVELSINPDPSNFPAQHAESPYTPPAASDDARAAQDVRETPALTIGPDGLINAPPRRQPPATADRKQMIELARQAAENARALSAAQNAERAKPKSKGGVRPGFLLIISIAAFLLAGSFFILGPKLWPGSTSIENPTPATVPSADPATPPAKTPEINDTAPPSAPKQQGMAPSGATPDPRGNSEQATVQGLAEGTRSTEAVGRFSGGATTPSASPTVPGIALDGGERAVTALDLARARQRAHLANLSQQTAQNAARPPAVETVALPASVSQNSPAIETASVPAKVVVAPTAARPEAKSTLELPPLQIGPNSLRTAAANGDASAQFEVAARFAEAKGVTQDFALAAVWYQRAATQGLAQAQYRLASLYERGLGVDSDGSRARVWYSRAAEQGNLKAMHNLAVLSAGSDNGTPDYTTAAHWFSRAAEHGLADSQFNLGVLHENGLGVTKDPIGAYKWYALAAAGGDAEAARRRELLKPKLDPMSLAAGLRAVGEWKPRAPNALANDPRVAGEAWKARAQLAQ